MDWASILKVAQIVMAGGLITAILLHLREWPKARAEAHRIRVQADGEQWDTLNREIGRIAARLEKVEKENEALRDRLDKQRGRERTLEHENEQLRQHVERLETRLAALENLFKTQPLSPEMQEALANLDKTAPRKRRAG